MKSNENLSHAEIMTALSDCFRDLIKTEVSHRNMPVIINKGKAAAQLVTAMHREQIMEVKRQSAQKVIHVSQTNRKRKIKHLNT